MLYSQGPAVLLPNLSEPLSGVAFLFLLFLALAVSHGITVKQLNAVELRGL